MATKFFRIFVLSMAILGVCNLSNASDYCDNMELGWHFYCDPAKHKETAESNEMTQAQKAQSELKQVQERLEELKVQAVMYPTEDNLKNYITYQKEQLERAEKFADVWGKVLWKTPSLDAMVTSPINSIGNEVRYEIANKAIEATLLKLNKNYGIFFFYSSNCVFCQKFSPIIKVLADKYQLNVMAVSMDGVFLPEWPNSVVNQGQAKAMGMDGQPVPAVMLFGNAKSQVIPVGFGLLSMQELEKRIYELTNGAYEN
jgi:conjugal transfer pilus assembly protein TraF